MLGIFFLVRRSLSQHRLSTVVTVLAGALASGLVMAVFAITAQSRAAFTGGESGFDAVLGARGSELQLVLNTVYHLETSPGNIPWSLYKAMKDRPDVKLAVADVASSGSLVELPGTTAVGLWLVIRHERAGPKGVDVETARSERAPRSAQL